MRRFCFLSFLFLGLTGFCFSQNRNNISPQMQKLFFNFNVLYDHEKLSMEDDFRIESNNVLFEIAIGYDFGRIVPRVLFDIGVPFYGVVDFSDGSERINDAMDTQNFKFGIELGIKPIKAQRFDVIVPLGVLSCRTVYKQKEQNYTSGVPYDRVWEYDYINFFSGVYAVYQLNKNFKAGFFSRIGLPVKKVYEYKEVLPGNYVWTSNNSSTYSIKSDVEVLNFSMGIGVLANL